jgi:hypothetical protein
MSPSEWDLRVAVHEVGHLAAAYLLGVPRFGEVSITEDTWCAGHAKVGYELSPDDFAAASEFALVGLQFGAFQRRIEADAMVAMAGPMAEIAGEDLWAMYPHCDPECKPGSLTFEVRKFQLDAWASGVPEPPSDRDHERDLLRRASGREVEADAYRTWLLAKTGTLVSMNPAFKRIVDVVAPELVRCRVLSKRQSDAAIRRAFAFNQTVAMEKP